MVLGAVHIKNAFQHLNTYPHLLGLGLYMVCNHTKLSKQLCQSYQMDKDAESRPAGTASCLPPPLRRSTWGATTRGSGTTSSSFFWNTVFAHKPHQEPSPACAQVVYMERDHRELSESVQSAPAPLRPLYAQMATAKRSESLGVAHTEHLFRLRPPRTPRRRCMRGAGWVLWHAGARVCAGPTPVSWLGKWL
jgi:hypothetical protein